MELVERLSEYYKENPEVVRKFDLDHWCLNDFSLDKVLSEVSKSPPLDVTMNALEEYYSVNKSGTKLSALLAYAPAEDIISNFGEDVLFWAWVTGGLKENADFLLEGISRCTGKDPKALEAAKMTAWRILRSGNPNLVKLIYEYNKEIFGGVFDSFDLKGALERNVVGDVNLSEDRVERYSLGSFRPRNSNFMGPEENWNFYTQKGSKRFTVYLDSPSGVGLMYKGKPVAILGAIPTDEETLKVIQLQGVRPKIFDSSDHEIGTASTRGLAYLDWRKMMVEVAEYVSRNLDFSRISIQSGKNNCWIMPKGEDRIHLSEDVAIQKYDRVAERMEYVQARDGDWYKNLDS